MRKIPKPILFIFYLYLGYATFTVVGSNYFYEKFINEARAEITVRNVQKISYLSQQLGAEQAQRIFNASIECVITEIRQQYPVTRHTINRLLLGLFDETLSGSVSFDQTRIDNCISASLTSH